MKLSKRLRKFGSKLGALTHAGLQGFGSALDEIVYTVSPRAGTRRKAYRKKWEMASRLAAKYWESSDSDRFRGENWLTSKLSPDSAMEDELEEQAARAKDMYRNDGYAASFVDGRVNNIVGRGIRPQARVALRKGVIDEAGAETINNQLDAVHRRYVKNVTRDGQSLWEVQRQVDRCLEMVGEAFVLFDHDPDAHRLLPLVMEVIDPQRIQTPPEQTNNPHVRLGIERDPKTKRVVAYYVRTTHPGDNKKVDFKFRRIEKYHSSGRVQMVHLFEQIFPGQTRGFTPMSPILGELKDLKDIKEAILITEQIAACFSVFVSSETNPEDFAEGSATETRSTGERIQDVEPGRITYLGPDEKVTVGTPNPGNNVGTFLEYNLRGIAAGLQYPYELLTKNWSGLNYSSGRLSLIDGRISFGCRQQLIGEQLLDEYWKWFVAEVIIFAPDEIDIELLDYDREPWVFEMVTWVSPGWPWIDPTKEVQADALSIEGNLDTLQARLAARGLDLEETLTQRKREIDLLTKLGLPTAMPQMNRYQEDDD